jgi:cytochrome o ubiquinol oxidase subunit II
LSNVPLVAVQLAMQSEHRLKSTGIALSRFRIIALLPLMAMLSSCNFVVLSPSGDVAAQQRDLVVISTILMLLIIIPVMALTVLFAWRYRQSNKAARYEPDWDHSVQLELVIWAAPLLIIICLGALTWMGTHLLDPYREVSRIGANQPVPAQTKSLRVDVVALDWKWLFIYPEQGIATVNQLTIPVGTPISFQLTSSNVMNSFFVPQLGGQIYTMAGMVSRLHLQADHLGTYRGLSAQYSGEGFADMRFDVNAVSAERFAQWTDAVRDAGPALDAGTYADLARPSKAVAPSTYRTVAPDLFSEILSAGMSSEDPSATTHSMSQRAGQ